MVSQTPRPIPLISASTLVQLDENIGALEVGLGDKRARLLADASG
jgi:aryl-alcohol dehydrogenase-like predicted oxidoreductase